MDTQQISAPSRASSGVVHDNSRHTSRFTVVGNHLTQHRELSLTAIGLAAHIQSMPAGAGIGIKDLADRFPESEARIAAALRELEAHGYLRRTRTRLANGRIVTRTVSCNQPSDQRRTDALPGRDCPQRTVRPPAPVRPCNEPEADDAHLARSRPRTHTKPTPRSEPAPLLVPKPAFPAASLLRTATDLLAGLHRQDPRLLLSAQDVDALAPGVAAWLEREVGPAAVQHALTSDLPPEGMRRPAGLLAHRLTTRLPPPPPFLPPAALPPRPVPLQNCEGCDRGFRAAEPGECPDCRTNSHPTIQEL
ncbi:helix-turn-helix domain-containing protein [Streptomyces atratus]|uniref:helix-turn-helix domain-containing protein n=1 Tax=Streptomyces atratus TaxID=1893 RepID=UPI00225A3983|nr:helix-turn-helix domain-containing protein [Streptomyces atratus]MCX5341679.1 helix-turn-helix domain-containing protein [Streptomyces atratus]